MNSNLLGMLGLARRGGMLAVGEEPAQEAAQQKNARLLLLASDAAVNTERRVQRFAEEGSCLWTRAPFTKTELGSEVGRSSCAILAVTDIGLAAAIARRLADEDAARYGELAEKLSVKAKRAAERKAERHSREKSEKHARRFPPKSADAEKGKGPSAAEKHPTSEKSPRSDKLRTFHPGNRSKENERRGFGKNRGSFESGYRSSNNNRGAFGKDHHNSDDDHRSFGNSRSKPDGNRRSFGTDHRSGGGQKSSRSFTHSPHASRPFSNSMPVKKGKGSFRKKSDGK